MHGETLKFVSAHVIYIQAIPSDLYFCFGQDYTSVQLRSVGDKIFTHCMISDSMWGVGMLKTEGQAPQCCERNHLPVLIFSLQLSYEIFWSRTLAFEVKV